MARRALTSMLVAVVLAAFVPTAAVAETPDISTLTERQRDELAALFKRARAAFEAERYNEAIGALERAHEIFPEPNILYRIGDAHERLGNLEQAIDYYGRYVEAAPDASDAGLVARRIQDLKLRLEGQTVEEQPDEETEKLAVLVLDTNPTGADVHIDDEPEPRGTTPLRIELDPGTRKIRVERAEHEPVERSIELAAGETISLVYPLQKVEVEEVGVEDGGPGVLPWIFGGAGVALLGTSTGFFVASSSADAQIDAYDQARRDAYRNDEPVPERPDDYDRLVRRRYFYTRTAWVTGAAGILAVGGSAVLFLVGGQSEAPRALLLPSPGGMAFRLTW